MSFKHFWECSARILLDSDYRFYTLAKLGKYNDIPDEEYLKRMFKARMGKDLNLENPQTYNEKINWLKIHDRKPIYTTMVDKYEAKRFVAERIGDEFIIPTIGIWDKYDDIDFKKLPNQFVLKCTHDSGGLVICKDIMHFDFIKAKKKIENSLTKDFYYMWREWPYKDVKHRIIAEKYMEDSVTHDLRDYKIFTFNGVAKVLFVATERQDKKTDTKFDFFDREYNHLDIINGHPNASVPPEKPKNLELMFELAEKLSQGIPTLRVDFYEVDGKVFFGELTFSHWSGMVPFEPEVWDYTFGSWTVLPSI